MYLHCVWSCPQFPLLDESTTTLDAQLEHLVQLAMTKDVACPTMIKNCTQIIHSAKVMVIEEGRHKEHMNIGDAA